MEKVKEWFMNNKPVAIAGGLVVLVVFAFLAIRAKKKAAISARLKKARAAKRKNSVQYQHAKTSSRTAMQIKMAKLRAMRGKKQKA